MTSAASPLLTSAAAGPRTAAALDDGTRRRSWDELEARVSRLARWLRDDLGLGPDDHVASLVGNRVEGVELILASLAAGVWLTPLNWHLTADEIAYIVRDAGTRILFTDAANAAVAARVEAERRIEVGAELDRLLERVPDAPLSPDGPAGGTMIYTSGTTGKPKGVKRARAATLGAALARMRDAGRSYGLDGRGPHLVTGPLYHAAPSLLAIYDLLNGASLVLMDRWDAARCLALIDGHAIRHTHLVPTMFVRLLKLAPELRAGFDGRTLTLVLHGAAPVSAEIKRQMIAWWGPVLVEYWGATEGGVATIASAAEWLARPGTVGRPIASFEVYAADEQGRRLPAGEVGLLRSRHKTLAQVFEYHGDPAKTAATHPEPHVFTTGDLGYVDGEGYVFLTDRTTHLIISGGVNIYPAEIEGVLVEHPAVADVAVFGIPDDEWGESVKAAVELAEGFSASAALEAELLDLVATRLARYKVPRSIDFERALPRLPNGKLYVRALRERYWQGRARAI
ncbi:MAG: AMP-binding protein [bacterium]